MEAEEEYYVGPRSPDNDEMEAACIKIVLFIFQSPAVLLVTDGLSTGST
jgi:hypothetical protein